MTLAAAVHESVARVCPIEMVAIGADDDKATWRVHFAPHASEAQQAAAQKAIAAFDPLIVRKRALFARLDADAAAARAKVSTPGKDAIYAEKFAQAQAVVDMDEAKLKAMSATDIEEAFPLVAASIGLDGPDAISVANVFLYKGAETLQAVGRIERVCLSGKKAIASAPTNDAANAAYEAVTWPSP